MVIDPSNVKWNIIEAVIASLRSGQWGAIWGDSSGSSRMFAIANPRDNISIPQFNTHGVFALVALASDADAPRPDLKFSFDSIRFGDWYTYCGDEDLLDYVFGDRNFILSSIMAPDESHNVAADQLENWMLQHRVTDVVWTCNSSTVAPWTDEIDDSEIPVAFTKRHEDRMTAYLSNMNDQLSELFPNAMVTVYNGGWDGSFSPCRPWAKSADGWEWDGFIDVASTLDVRAAEKAWSDHPEPEPWDVNGYALVIDADGFQFFRNGNSEGRPQRTIKEAAEYLFSPVAYGGYAMSYYPEENGDMLGDVLCHECMIQEFLENLDEYLDGSRSVLGQPEDGDGRYESSTFCEGCNAVIQERLCPICGDPLREPRPEDDRFYGVWESDYYSVHHACVVDELAQRKTEYHSPAVPRSDGSVDVQIFGTVRNFKFMGFFPVPDLAEELANLTGDAESVVEEDLSDD